MRHRPKPPSLVSMWMLDVFCCALGCVTLLWLLNTREAGDQAKRAGNALEILNRTEQDLRATRAELVATKNEFDQTRRKLNADVEDLQGRLLAMTTERDEMAKSLALVKSDLATAAAKQLATDDELAKKQKDAKDLTAKLIVATQSTEELARLMRSKERERDDLALKAKKAEDQINDLDARLKSVTKEAADATSNLSALKKTGDELGAARAMIRDLQKKADDSNATIIDLQGQKAKLADKYDKLRVDSDARFAGIAMTGRRAVFAVDISGSMKLLDDKTPAPEKWPLVVETVAKVMRSVPDLERFQVITFSRKAEFLFGSGEWQDYRGEASARQVADALRKIEPVGDTNMYEALDLAFRLRVSGLDTLYLFSDGLPTSGPGLTVEDATKLSDGQKSEKLGRHIRTMLNSTWNRGTAGQRVKVNAIGFFFESPEVGAFLWALARDNDGSFVGMSRP